MTDAESAILNGYFAAIAPAEAAYNEERRQNALGHARWQDNDYRYPFNDLLTDWQSFLAWLKASDESLKAKEAALTAARTQYENYKAQLKAADDAAFRANNPGTFENIEKSRIAGEAQKAIELAKANYASNRTKYWIVGAVLIVIVIAGVWYFKFRKRGAAAS